MRVDCGSGDFAWSSADIAAAEAEGWGVFDSYGSAGGPVQIQRLDEEGVFESDTAAWEHVFAQALAGSELACKALAIIGLENPPELSALLRWVTDW